MLKNELYFPKTDINTIHSYASRMMSEFESGEIGYYHLPLEVEILSEIKEFLNNKIYDDVVLIGIGGSSVGVKAVVGALLNTEQKAELHILDNVDNFSFLSVVKKLNFERTLFIISSKSGTTIETISLFKLILKYFNVLNLDKNFVFITDPGSVLENFAVQNKAKFFNIPKNVGGRFSVLSAIGLMPFCALGLDCEALLKGAKAAKVHFLDNKDDTILQKAYHYATHKNAKINVVFSYCDRLAKFNDWYVQLWAESLGKKVGYKRLGLTPAGLIGSRDQHSFLQLIMDGPKDKTCTFIKVANQGNFTDYIPNMSLAGLEACNFTNGLSMNAMQNFQCEATKKALINEGISVDLITLEKLDEFEIGYLIYYYELLTSAVGLMLGINTYNQPGVEVGKRILKSLILKD
ncbi:glucose-6-phosphate isomerase [Campylobacter hominis]|uniref:Glucose-6-phosphate isomerase n=1 Tax=Campylobacter hominis (strain ATCC BAA-381 / DSM 21671 / CCUG 45161 / LMG 19568 / NCTC 13146 / CH001A) TaxID=360107 RepID=A7I0R9_CAMHC|nr:glucose-6-phosphate isomerase [Campylobacter hominis]ABS51461.1 glucose-6-phosphate isomerase [Campylobacter hominis ATCC BAA-381]UAK86595.1 glucose-6-phosphate isomerase [Campylobacter hominis]SUW84654.1 glucose-6-phosphate isomerase [Campylobacter hominis]